MPELARKWLADVDSWFQFLNRAARLMGRETLGKAKWRINAGSDLQAARNRRCAGAKSCREFVGPVLDWRHPADLIVSGLSDQKRGKET